MALLQISSFAQSDETQLIQSIWGLEKRAIVTEYMKFNETEATAFWPVYEDYQVEVKKLGAERMAIISDYANNLSNLSNEKADELVAELLKNNIAVDKLQAKYYKKMKSGITSVRAAQFIQLEQYLQTMIRAEIQNNLPLIGELDKKAK